MNGPVAAVFFGSGGFAVPILEALVAAPDVTTSLVVTAPPRPAGRGGRAVATPVGARAAALGLPLATPERLADAGATAPLLAAASQLVVLADYGRLLPRALVEAPAHGALNLHPSLLPRWRGATPVTRAIAAGDVVTGVSLMRMDAGLDSGPLIARVATPIGATDTAPELEARLAALAAALLREHLGPWLRGDLAATPQAADGITLAPAFRREEGRLDPARPASELARRVRACQPWPGTFTATALGRLVLWRATARADAPPGALPGTFVADGDELGLVVGQGWLRLDEVQLAGGRRMPGAALRRGHPGLVGTRAGAAA